MARRSLWQRVKDAAKAFVNPASYAPPPLPTRAPPPPPAATPRRDRTVSRPPRETRQTYIPRDELPREWGPNKAALWSEASMGYENIGRDPVAQAFYDAALYTFAESHEARKAIFDNFIDYVETTYGVDWRDIFDWEGYREIYDSAGGTFEHGGELTA